MSSVLIVIFVSIGIIFISECKKEDEVTNNNNNNNNNNNDTCYSLIDNGCLEQWTELVNAFDTPYFEITGPFLGTLNELYALPYELGGPGPLTTERTTDVYKGTYAAKLVSSNFYALFIPGMLGTTTLDIPNSTIHIGRPFTYKPSRLQGYYKFQPAGGDSASVVILLSKHNSSLLQRDTIGYGKQVFYNATDQYSLFDIVVEYRDSVTAPDSISIIIVSSDGYSLDDLYGCQGQLGSALWVDNLDLVY